MIEQASTRSRQERYFWLLSLLLFLFCLRVLGQVLVAFFGVWFLPPMEEWFSGFLPYPELLTSQIVIILVYGKVSLDFARGRGFFVLPRRRLGINLLKFGALYLGVMIIRYVIRMALYPHERWTGGCIPIFFHWVLASFLLVLGHYHWSATREAMQAEARRPSWESRLFGWVQAGLVALGALLWIGYQLAPLILAYKLGFRPSVFAVRAENNVAMTTSDGTVLLAQIYHPQHADRTPAILIRIPLSRTFKNSFFVGTIGQMWAERGYTVVIQGTRGRFGSGGTFYPLRGERQDGIETLAWISRQSWFNGKIATWGGSAFGYTQWAISDQERPGPSALTIYFASSDFHRMFYPGGAFSLYSALSWAARSHGRQDLDDFPPPDDVMRAANGFPLVKADQRMVGEDIPFFKDWAQHRDRDAYWADIDGAERSTSIKAPVLLMAGWYDPFLPTQLDDFSQLQRAAAPHVARQSRLIIGPWTHASEVVFPGGERAVNFRLQSLAVSLPWFDENLQSSQSQQANAWPVKIFVMGKNQWRLEKEWPLSRAVSTPFYLRSSGNANSANGKGALSSAAPMANEPADSYVFDPHDPVPSAGGAMIGEAAGIARQNAVERRHDVLVYTTEELPNEVEVTGPITLVLYVSSSVDNTDFTGKLVDVHPDGSAYNVSEGILRRRYVAPATSIHQEEIQIDLWPTSMVFFKGHRIRLEISSSNFPRFDRNPNTDNDIATETNSRPAIQIVRHGLQYPSRLILPIVPAQ